jgi:DNA-binding NarL/FixJ family response regulator
MEPSSVATARGAAGNGPAPTLAVLHQVKPASLDQKLVRVLIADGRALMRAGLRALLEAGGSITIVGEAATGEQAVALARRTGPDVVLLDARLPGLDAVEVTGQVASEPGVSVLLVPAWEADERNYAALRAGASGLLGKDTAATELVPAVELLARGDVLLPPTLTRRLIAELASRPAPICPSPELLDELTAREREVVALVGAGLSNNQIAERLVVTPATAKTHVSRAMVKLGVRDRAKLVVFAYEAGLVVPRAGHA